MPMPARRPGLPGPDGSTPKWVGRLGSMPEPNAKRRSSLNTLANLNGKRKASDLEETGHVRSPIKQESALPVDDSQDYTSNTSPDIDTTMQDPSTDGMVPGRENDDGNSGTDASRSSSRLDDSLPVVKEEADSPDHDSREANDVGDKTSSSDLIQPDMWDVSESEVHTSVADEDSSDGESVASAFSLGMERQESGEPNESSRGPDNLYGEEPNEVSRRRGMVQDQDSNSRKRPKETTANGSNRTERDPHARSMLRDDNNHARDESSETPEIRLDRRNDETTATGKRRQRALAKDKISARDISRSWKTANPADKMMMKMKEKGCGWLEIRKAWQELTGEWPAASTLPNRYTRVKDNLTRLKPGDGQRLLDAAADVEAQFQRAKWRLIAEAMERNGSAKYSNTFIQKKYDELSRNPDMFGSLIDEEGSDASESDPVSRRDNATRLQQSGANSRVAKDQARSENSHGNSHAIPAKDGTASGFGSLFPREEERSESPHRRKRRRPSGSNPVVSHEEAKYMAKHKALNAVNRAKSWEVIAQECGMTAPLNDITQALERAGYLEAHGSARSLGRATSQGETDGRWRGAK